MGQSVCKLPNTPWETIEKTLKDLIDDSQFWLDPSICQNLSVVYRDHLLGFERSNLFDVAVTIGVAQPGIIDTAPEKAELCKRIINYYSGRLKMLQDVWGALKETRDKIDRAKNGPVCLKIDSYVENEKQCLELGGEWSRADRYQTNLLEFKQDEPGVGWQLWLERYNTLNSEYCKRFNKIWKLIEVLKKDVTHTYTPENMQQIEAAVYDEIEKLRRSCNYLYLALINLPLVVNR